MYDLIIIGGGPAAITAGIYAARKRMKVLLVAKDWGGQVVWAPDIDNYTGVPNVKGMDLVNKMVVQLKENELEIKEGEEVTEIIKKEDESLEIKTKNSSYSANALIMATGRTSKKINAEGEEKFIGKGISYCAICDAPLYRDKIVAVIGGGNTGVNTALEVAKYASQVYIMGYRPEPPADEYLHHEADKNPKITFYHNTTTLEFKGDKFIKSFVYLDKNTEEKKELEVDGVFIAIGSIPNSTLLENMVELNEKKEIKIDCNNTSSVKNIFAAGDVTDVSHKQIIIAAGEGAKAALNAYNYLNKKKGE
ncbi:MAG: FAD-dependent oxidoreductase [Candidatus Portnoybacteria bacterium]